MAYPVMMRASEHANDLDNYLAAFFLNVTGTCVSGTNWITRQLLTMMGDIGWHYHALPGRAVRFRQIFSKT